MARAGRGRRPPRRSVVPGAWRHDSLPGELAWIAGDTGLVELSEASVTTTLGAVLKYREDVERVQQHGVADLVKQAYERGLAHS